MSLGVASAMLAISDGTESECAARKVNLRLFPGKPSKIPRRQTFFVNTS